jgi:hypothetical protein
VISHRSQRVSVVSLTGERTDVAIFRSPVHDFAAGPANLSVATWGLRHATSDGTFQRDFFFMSYVAPRLVGERGAQRKSSNQNEKCKQFLHDILLI